MKCIIEVVAISMDFRWEADIVGCLSLVRAALLILACFGCALRSTVTASMMRYDEVVSQRSVVAEPMNAQQPRVLQVA